MTRACLFIPLFLAACSPDPETPEKPGKPAAANPAVAPVVEVPFKDLGWDGTRYTLKDAATGQEKLFTGTTTKYSKKSSRLLARYQVKDGVYHGLVEEWYENGQQKTKTSYENGKHQGDNFYWNENGTLQVHKVWKDDILQSETPGP